MLRELKTARQWDNEPARRVFADSAYDLFVWCDSGVVTRFQLGYDKAGNPRAFEWVGGQLFHYRVDSGHDQHTQHNRTPLLIPVAGGRPTVVADELELAGMESDNWILDFVTHALRSG